MTPKKAHTVVATLEMFTWAFLIFSMIMKYSGTTDAITPIAGGIHGFGFLCFVVVTIVIWLNNRWSIGWGIAGLAVSAIPFAALPFMIFADKNGKLEGNWRMTAADPTQPQTLGDKLLSQLMKHTARTAVILLSIVVIVFCILLYLGPPVDVEAVIEGQ
ncbi:DUF3817 domain-containing protein [Corynebacterium sp. ZY180755]